MATADGDASDSGRACAFRSPLWPVAYELLSSSCANMVLLVSSLTIAVDEAVLSLRLRGGFPMLLWILRAFFGVFELIEYFLFVNFVDLRFVNLA